MVCVLYTGWATVRALVPAINDCLKCCSIVYIRHNRLPFRKGCRVLVRSGCTIRIPCSRPSSLDLGMNRWDIGNGIGLEFEMTCECFNF